MSAESTIASAIDGWNKEGLIDERNKQIDNGACFSSSDYFTLAATTSVYLALDNSALVGKMHLDIPLIVATGGPVTVEYFVGSVFTGGTEMLSFNRNGTSSRTPTATVLYAPTVTNEGIRASGVLVPASSGGVFRSSAATPQDVQYITTGDLMIKVTNKDSSAIQFSYRVTWEERI